MQHIEINQALDASEYQLLVDVRTPLEFEKGHIPGAINIPLFSNEERAVVGTAYKQRSPREAFLLGLKLVGPKMADYVAILDEVAQDKKIICYCWRGGKRSQSMSWLFEKSGYKVNFIHGGYKAYRKFVRAQFKLINYPFIVLGGRTGCGKSEILKSLEKQKAQVVDLEGLANHKGSAFGHIDELPQPSIEHFENLLYNKLEGLDRTKWIWIENESRLIGSIHLETSFWNQMKAAPLIYIDYPAADRFNYLVDTYGTYPVDALKSAFAKIKKRLGGKRYHEAIAFLDEGKIEGATQIALDYYDNSYKYMLENNSAPNIKKIFFKAMDFEKNAEELTEFLNNEFQLEIAAN